MNILRKINETKKEIRKSRTENDRLKKEHERLKYEEERLRKQLRETLFLILDNKFPGIPFDIIERLRKMPTSKETMTKIVYVLTHAYDADASFATDAPLWYAIVAETYLCEELIDPVIGLSTTTDNDWDFLSEQGLYLLGKLAQKYPDLVMKKVTATIDKMIAIRSELPYLFLFDAFYFADPNKYKSWFLKTLKNPDLYWLDSYASNMSDLQIKEAAPIMKEILDKKDVDTFTKRNLEEAIEQIATRRNKYPEISKPYCEKRGEWKEHYKDFEDRFMEPEEDDYADEDYETQEPLKSQKIGRNDPCPCGSGKKYKKCCGK